MDRLRYQFYEWKEDQPWIWIREVFNEGPDFVEFDGRFHVEASQLPLPYILCISEYETTPYLVENGVRYYRLIRSTKQDVEVIRHEIIEDTSVVSKEMIGEEMMNVCFTPTARQKIWFKVVGDSTVV